MKPFNRGATGMKQRRVTALVVAGLLWVAACGGGEGAGDEAGGGGGNEGGQSGATVAQPADSLTTTGAAR